MKTSEDGIIHELEYIVNGDIYLIRHLRIISLVDWKLNTDSREMASFQRTVSLLDVGIEFAVYLLAMLAPVNG